MKARDSPPPLLQGSVIALRRSIHPVSSCISMIWPTPLCWLFDGASTGSSTWLLTGGSQVNASVPCPASGPDFPVPERLSEGRGIAALAVSARSAPARSSLIHLRAVDCFQRSAPHYRLGADGHERAGLCGGHRGSLVDDGVTEAASGTDARDCCSRFGGCRYGRGPCWVNDGCVVVVSGNCANSGSSVHEQPEFTAYENRNQGTASGHHDRAIWCRNAADFGPPQVVRV